MPTCFEIIKLIVEAVLAIGAIVAGSLGFFLWRKQVRGNDLYSSSKEALFKLKQLLNLIDELRYVYLTVEQENNLWKKIHKQFSLYENNIIMVMILSKNKVDDVVNGKSMKDYLTTILKSKHERNYLIEIHNKGEVPEEQRKENNKRILELFSIVKNNGKEQDNFGDELNTYFKLMYERLKTYIK